MKSCDHCQLLSINGILCHETGCPVAWKDYKRECKNCDKEFKPKEKEQTTCSKRCYKDYYGV